MFETRKRLRYRRTKLNLELLKISLTRKIQE